MGKNSEAATEHLIKIDPELLVEFIDEATELLAPLDNLFLDLSKKTDDLEVVNAIFRPFHTIKGNSSYFGLLGVRNLTHEVETFLDGIRKGRHRANPEKIELLLQALDMLRAMIARVQAGEAEISDADALEELIGRIERAGKQKDIQEDKADFGVMQAVEILEQKVGAYDEAALDAILVLKEIIEEGDFAKICSEASPNMQEITSTSSLGIVLGRARAWRENSPENAELDAFPGKMEQLLREIQEHGNQEAELICREMISDYDTLRSAMGFDELLVHMIEEKCQAISDLLPDLGHEDLPAAGEDDVTGSESASDADGDNSECREADTRGGDGKRRDSGSAQKTMRVAENQIDEFLAYVGELLVVGDMFEHLQDRISGSAELSRVHDDFKLANSTFNELSDKLQGSIMDLRKVPVSRLLSKAPRLAHDVAVTSSREIKVELYGEKLRIDKRHAELLDAPLTHMVRNAADHGIESPEERIKAGKAPEGLLKVGIDQTDQEVVFAVSDDGRGLDLAKIEAKARSIGIIDENSQMTDKDVVNLIFASGISTAEQVTDVSGRGVGMNVVQKSVEDAGGHISVHTNPGAGSEFRIVLPRAVSTQIISGYIVESARQFFVFPLESVLYSASVSKRKMVKIAGKGLCVEAHGKVIRGIDLREVLNVRAENHDISTDDELLILGIESGSEEYALIVDKVVGIKKVVKRPIHGLLFDGPASVVDGAALQGDGSISIILNPVALLEVAGNLHDGAGALHEKAGDLRDEADDSHDGAGALHEKAAGTGRMKEEQGNLREGEGS